MSRSAHSGASGDGVSRGGRSGGGPHRGGSHGKHSHPHAANKRSYDNLLSQTSSSSTAYSSSGNGSNRRPPAAAGFSAVFEPAKRPRREPSDAASTPSSLPHPLGVYDLLSDSLTPVANAYWAPGQPSHLPYEPRLIESIYASHLASASSSSPSASLIVLELSGYLEHYLWPHWSASGTAEHLLSLLLLVNHKALSGIQQPFASLLQPHNAASFPVFFHRLLLLKRQRDLSVGEATEYLLFLLHLFSALEQPILRKQALRLVSLPLWRSLSRVRRERELRGEGRRELRRLWQRVVAECEQGRAHEERDGAPSLDSTAAFLPRLLAEFVSILYSLPAAVASDNEDAQAAEPAADAEVRGKVLYCQRCVELCIDLLSQLPTRRFCHALLDDCHIIALCRLSPLHPQPAVAASASSRPSSSPPPSPSASSVLFQKLVDQLQYYSDFDVDDQTGEPVPPPAVLLRYHQRIAHLQRLVHRDGFQQLQGMAVVNVGSLDSVEGLNRWLQAVDTDVLMRLCVRLRLMDAEGAEEEEQDAALHRGTVSSRQIVSQLPPALQHQFLLSVLHSHLVSHTPHQQLIATLPLYPTESLLFDSSVFPAFSSSGPPPHPLPLPKLQLQFLTLSDYLLRNFTLFRLEASYAIREDLSYAVARSRPRLSNDGQRTLFTGWGRMCVPISRFAVMAVKPPVLGSEQPREVRAEVEVDLGVFTGLVRAEWEELKEFDVLFLLTVRARVGVSAMTDGEREDEWEEDDAGGKVRKADFDAAFSGGGGVGGDDRTDSFRRLQAEGNSIVYVRGCELRQVVDESGRVIGERDEDGRQHHATGNRRTYRVLLDPAQYSQDMQRLLADERQEDVYTAFNLLVRRRAKENNFKGLLQSVRDILQARHRELQLPHFLQDVFLGYGDAESSQYWRLQTEQRSIEFVDTFIDEAHVAHSFAMPVTAVHTDAEEGRRGQGEEEEKEGEGEQDAGNSDVISSADVSANTTVARASAGIRRSLTALCRPAALLPLTGQPSYRLTFPLRQRPDHAALHRLIDRLQLDPASAAAYQPQLSHPHLVHPAVPFSTPPAPPPALPAAVVALHEPPPQPPVLPPLLPPAPFAGVEPVFSRPHPVLHLPSLPASPSPPPAAAAEAGTAAESAPSPSAESLSSLTVKALKQRLKEAGLTQGGTKAELVTRLLQLHRLQEEKKQQDVVKDSSSQQDEAKDGNSEQARRSAADAEIKQEAGAAERERYEVDMADFQRAKEDYHRLLRIYEEEKVQHEEQERVYQEQRRQQEEIMAAYRQQLAEWQQSTGQQPIEAGAGAEKKDETQPVNGADATVRVEVDADGSELKLPTPPVSARTRSHDRPATPAPATAEASSAAPASLSPTPASAAAESASTASSSLPASSSAGSSILMRRIPRVRPHSVHVRHNTVRFTPLQVEAIHSGVNPGLTLIVGPPGTGKCFAAGTRLRLHSGDTVAVQDIKGGERLMGDDGSPRIVTPGSLNSGRAALYTVQPLWEGAAAFTVNGDHILVLANPCRPWKQQQSAEADVWTVSWYELDTVNSMQRVTQLCHAEHQADRVLRLQAELWSPLEWEVSVDQFLQAPLHVRSACQLMQAGPVTFDDRRCRSLHDVLAEARGCPCSPAQVEWTAWALGLWLSRGGAGVKRPGFQSAIAARLLQCERLFGERLWAADDPAAPEQDASCWLDSCGIIGCVIRAYGLVGSPRLPRDCLCDSLAVRRCVLAGIIDGAAEFDTGTASFRITAAHWQEAAAYKVLAASLGIRNSSIAHSRSVNAETEWQQDSCSLHLSGSMTDVLQHCVTDACRQLRLLQRDSEASSRYYGFRIAAQGEGDYFGFTVHGGVNRRFLLEDFTVTHNTDTAVQIISELLHNHPTERILLVTHSNAALNDLFEKVMERDVDERFLLRLGRGSEELEVGGRDFSRFGRVQHMLARRLQLLKVVEALSQSIQLTADVAYSCETSAHFFIADICSRWEAFVTQCRQAQDRLDSIRKQREATEEEQRAYHATPSSTFPFTAFFSASAPASPLFSGLSYTADLSVSLSCFAYLQSVFSELEECRPFELLRGYRDRSSYLLTHHSRVVAMTCTHAAIKRADFIAARLQYDSVIMEESAQVLEVETFIPLMLQHNDAESGSRLKRVVLLGDHQQLPPVIKNRSLQSACHLDQSLFTRLVRLGIPSIQLNAQGRSRPSLAALWNWRYDGLRDLPVTVQSPVYQQANPGFLHDYQLVDVQEYGGQGESTPSPFFFQNLGEAEYAVAVYQYMRLLGYPASRISILTTYNGQRQLIRDVLQQRCARNPLFGLCRVSTVDQYQGQQNDFILLSLVRTRHAGHLRDVRRLTVAMSRARLGLYVFARAALFINCVELTRSMQRLQERSLRLLLVPAERAPFDRPLWTPRRLGEDSNLPAAAVEEVRDVVDMGERVVRMTREIQGEYVEYRRRVEAWEREQAEAAEKKRREEEERREAMESMLAEEYRLTREAARDAALATETERLERELLDEQKADERSRAGAATEAETQPQRVMQTIDEDEEDDDVL